MISQKTARRVGLIVPSSNVTMETEIPALLRAREDILPDHFTFHSSRMRMKNVTKEELERMDDDSLRCAVELSDAAVEVQAYACLVAIMSRGHGYHNTSAKRLFDASTANGSPTPTVSSAGALVDALHALGAKKVSIICPYMKPLTKMVVDYIEGEGVEVKDYLALEIPNNLDVAYKYLKDALKLGYSNFDRLQQDSDLQNMRSQTKKWKCLMDKYFQDREIN